MHVSPSLLFFCCFFIHQTREKILFLCYHHQWYDLASPCQDFQVFILFFFESSTALYNSRIPTVLKTSHKKGGQNILFHSTLNCCFSIVPPFCDTQINSNKAICTFSYFVFLFILSLCFETSQTIVFISPFQCMLCYVFFSFYYYSPKKKKDRQRLYKQVLEFPSTVHPNSFFYSSSTYNIKII